MENDLYILIIRSLIIKINLSGEIAIFHTAIIRRNQSGYIISLMITRGKIICSNRSRTNTFYRFATGIHIAIFYSTRRRIVRC